MGLALEVGILADLKSADPEGYADFTAMFSAVNELLGNSNLPDHLEPTECDVWSGEMVGYSGLHYLRRLAARLDAGESLPEPGARGNSSNRILDAYFNAYLGKESGFLSRRFRKWWQFDRQFDHLIIHSDAEGFYLPSDFPDVLVGTDNTVPGGMVGSAPRLLEELERLASVLEIPNELHSQSDELWDAADSQGEGEFPWEQYGIESYSCVVLREGCRECLRIGAALVFC